MIRVVVGGVVTQLVLLAQCAKVADAAFLSPHKQVRKFDRKFDSTKLRSTPQDTPSSTFTTTNNNNVPGLSSTTPTTTKSILITFDLDDTLFPIQPVVDAANDAQIQAMRALGYTETSMDDCMVQTRSIRRDLTEPITYTDLRKSAIRAEMKRLLSSSSSDDDETLLLESHVEQCFGAWLEARHAAAEDCLFPEAVPALQDLRTNIAAAAAHHHHHNYGLCIGAITNGRGNPLCMTNTLAPLFDFCVSGEDDDVFPHRKPHPNIYRAALCRWQTITQQQQQSCEDGADNGSSSSSSSRTKPDVWLHVGDCLANDVGASHDVGAHAIWVAPVVTSEEEGPQQQQQPSWSTATEKDRQERATLMEAAKSKIRGQISNLSELNQVVQTILLQQQEESSTRTTGTNTANSDTMEMR